MQVFPQGLPVLQTGGFGGVMWQVFPFAMQVLPQGTPFLQLGAAVAMDENASAAAAARMIMRMGGPPSVDASR